MEFCEGRIICGWSGLIGLVVACWGDERNKRQCAEGKIPLAEVFAGGGGGGNFAGNFVGWAGGAAGAAGTGF